MRPQDVLALCLELPGAWPDQPWGDGVVAKVGRVPGKIFAFPGEGAVSIKLAPEDGAELRRAYPTSVGNPRYVANLPRAQRP